jgi:[protein-PII] uridylyltransferase
MYRAATRKAPSQFVEAFCSGMPTSYWLHHEHHVIRDHAEIVWRRKQQLVHVELAPTQHGSVQCISVVTDDRPGLLSLLAAALSAHALDIISAKIYCRVTGGTVAEAVDFFLVRRRDDAQRSAPFGEVQLGSLRRMMTSLLRGETNIERLPTRPSQTLRSKRRARTEVQFDDRRGETDRLTVDAEDRPGLLVAITTALFVARVSISGAEVLTVGDRAHDEFDVLEWNGSQVVHERKLVIVGNVAAAIDAMG